MLQKLTVVSIVLAFFVRLLMLLYVYPTSKMGMTQEDIAYSIITGHGISEKIIDETGKIKYIPTAHDMPGHGILLAGTWWLTGIYDFIFIQLIQILIDSFMCLCVRWITLQFFNEKIAVFSCLFYALYPPQAWLSVLPMRDVWGVFGVILSTVFVLKYLKNEKIRNLFLAGIITGLSVYFRPILQFFPFFLGGSLLFTKGIKKSIFSIVIMMCGVFIVLLPWVIRNYYHFNKIILSRTVLYQSMWQGFGEFRNPFGAVNNDEVTIEQMRKEGFKGRPGSPEFDEFIKPKVIKVIREHPFWYLKTVLRRIPYALLINRIPWGILQDDRYWYHQMFARDMQKKSVIKYAKLMLRLNPGFLVTKMFDTIILFLAVFGICLTRRQWKETLFLLSIPLYFICVHIPIRIEGRYMVPFHWVYLIFISVAMIWLAEKITKRRKYEQELLEK